MRRGGRSTWCLWLYLSTATAGGCQRRVDIDVAWLNGALEARAAAVLQRPEVDKAFDALADAVTADPDVTKSGEGLLAQLGSDPGLQPAFAAIIEAVSEHPAVTRMMAKLMRQNPRASAETLGDLFEKKFTDVVEGPAFDQAFDAAFAGLLERADVGAAVHLFERAAAANPELRRTLDGVVQARLGDDAWSRRVVALNGGEPPDRRRATQLLLDKAFSDARLAKFYVEVASLPVIRKKAAVACGRLLEAPAFQRHLEQTLARMVGDPGFQEGAVAAMIGLLERRDDAKALEVPIRGLLERPIVGEDLAALLEAVNQDPLLAPIGHEAIAGIVADEGFRATLTALVDGW